MAVGFGKSPDDSSAEEVVLKPDDGGDRFNLDYRHVIGAEEVSRHDLELCVPSVVDGIRLGTELRVRFALRGLSGDPSHLEELLALEKPDSRRLINAIVAEKGVPSEQLYTTFDGVNLWLNLCYSPLASVGRADTYETSVRQVAAAAPSLVGLLDESRALEHGVRLVDLGPGKGQKTLPLLAELHHQRYSVDLDLVDASTGMLAHAMQTIFEGGLPADFLRDLKLHTHNVSFSRLSEIGIDRPEGQPAIFSLVGLTVGNFPVREIFPILRDICKPGDLILIDYQPYDPQRGLAELCRDYDSHLYRKFALQPLLEIIRLVCMETPDAVCELSIDDIVVTAEQHSPTSKIPEIVFRLKSKARKRFQGFVRRYIDSGIELPNPLRLHFSHKYSPRDFNLRLDRARFDRTGSEVSVSTPSGRGYKLLIARRRSDESQG